MFKVLVLLITLSYVHHTLALTCYQCKNGDKECEVSKADQNTCGNNIGSAQEAVCIRQVKKSDDKAAIRKCTIVNKGGQAACEAGYTCSQCTKDLCNSASPLAKTTYWTIAGFVLAYFLM